MVRKLNSPRVGPFSGSRRLDPMPRRSRDCLRRTTIYCTHDLPKDILTVHLMYNSSPENTSYVGEEYDLPTSLTTGRSGRPQTRRGMKQDMIAESRMLMSRLLYPTFPPLAVC